MIIKVERIVRVIVGRNVEADWKEAARAIFSQNPKRSGSWKLAAAS